VLWLLVAQVCFRGAHDVAGLRRTPWLGAGKQKGRGMTSVMTMKTMTMMMLLLLMVIVVMMTLTTDNHWPLSVLE
jgi:hypothetical protein